MMRIVATVLTMSLAGGLVSACGGSGESQSMTSSPDPGTLPRRAPATAASSLTVAPAATTTMATTPSTATTAPATSVGTVVGVMSAVQQAAVYEAALRHVYARTVLSLSPADRGIILVDHCVTGAGDRPLSFSETAGGERFSADLLDVLSHRLADVPFLGFVGSAREVIGPDHHPTLPQILRPGVLMVVSPIEITAEGAKVGVELVYPAGQGFVLVVALTGADAVVVDVRSPWIS